MAITAFSNLSITISDGGTVPSVDYLPTKIYVDIGSGNILKVTWNTPTASGNAVDSYIIYVLAYDSAAGSYKSVYTANIGKVNEYYLPASLFAASGQSFTPICIYAEAVSAYGKDYNGISNMAMVNVSKGCGTYTKVDTGYAQPVLKRTLTFANLDYVALKDTSGNEITDANGEPIYTKLASVQDDTTGWTLMQEFYAKDENNNWQKSNIAYEVLTDSNGEVVTDSSNNPVYVL
jgi:hypothetical protein